MIFWDPVYDYHTNKVKRWLPSVFGGLLLAVTVTTSVVTAIVAAVFLAQRFGPAALLAFAWVILIVPLWLMRREYKLAKVNQRIGDAL